MADQLYPLIIITHNDTRSQREVELEQAEIRSHASRISHRRRRLLNPSLSLRSGARTVHQRECGDPSICSTCLKIPDGWERGSLTRRDPFASYAGHDVPAICLDTMNRALDYGWSPIFAPIRPEEVSSLKVSWKRATVDFPFLFHAQAVAGVDWALLSTSEKDTAVTRSLCRTQLEQRQLAIQHLGAEIRKPAFQPSDAHIHAITLLACSGTLHESLNEPYPLSPLGSLQNIYFFGKFDYVLPHVRAMYNVVRLKGGLAAIKQYALADVLEVVDIYISTRMGKTPEFQLMRPKVLPLQSYPVVAMSASIKWDRNDSHGLVLIRHISKEVHQLITHMVQLTEIANLFYHNPSWKTLTTFLTLGRNEIQHHLLSLPTSQYDRSAFAVNAKCSSSLYDDGALDALALAELIRLAASIYSDMALFPLPWKSGVKLQLAERMRSIWETSQMQRLADNPQIVNTELSVWLLWFGCFAAFRSDHQEWFELELHRVLEVFYGPLERKTFDTVKQLLRGFLWWDPICDLAGQDLWFRLKSQTMIVNHELTLDPAIDPLPIRIHP